MSCFKVNHINKLKGSIWLPGAKNSVLPLLAATFLSEGVSVLHNCPMLSDVLISIKILEHLGCRCEVSGNTVTVHSEGCYGNDIPEHLMREMRSSIVFMGAVAAKSGTASMSLPGGCELGPRPIDLHLDAFERLGSEIECIGGKIVCRMQNGAVGTEIHLSFPSVGATENIILATATGNGTTVITNAAREPEIADLCDFLKLCGAKIEGAGTDKITIIGVKRLKGAEYTVMPDRIVAATYLCATAACSGSVCLNGANPEHLLPIISTLKDTGCEIKTDNSSVTINSSGSLKAFGSVSTQPYPGFPTDAGPLAVSLATVLFGTSVFIENIFDSRFKYIDELRRLGASIKTVGRVAIISGVKKLHSAEVVAMDLRGGAALVMAAMKAEGTSLVKNVHYIDRGYYKLEDGLNLLGADIIRID